MVMNTVKIFRSYRDAAKMLAASSVEDAYNYLMYVLDYGLDDVEPKLEGPAGAMFLITKPNIDASKRKAENGSKGGSKTSFPESEKEAKVSKCEANDKQTISKCEAEEGSRKKEVGGRKKEEKEGDYTPQKPPTGAVTERFNRFWAIYPNKTGKQAALKAWSKLKPSEELTKVILDAVEYQKTWEKWTKDNGRYVPNPATWLNQGRWEDEPPETAKRGAIESWGGNAMPGQAERETAERLRRFRDSLLDDGGGS